ncbi:MAG: tripartite tricarboxylate transporter substrate binding protein, partial [Alphaproteobacteria bacterium]|nr:tripartite tricarboxylate transporter substrate binding protein [Alphaproteobacteria bacterium]
MFSRMLLTAFCLALGQGLGLAAPVAAQEAFPSRPVQLINPYQPGGATDLMARALAAAMAPLLGQPMVVVNRDGAAGGVGSLMAA